MSLPALLLLASLTTAGATPEDPALRTDTASQRSEARPADRRKRKPGKRRGRKPPPEEGWKKKPYIRPVAGLSSWTNGKDTHTTAQVGAQAGMRYWQTGRVDPRWRGDARLQGTYMLSSDDVRGFELRAGNFIGPWWKRGDVLAGIQAGPDLFYNQYSYGKVELPPTAGLALPVTGHVGVDAVSGYAGLQPAWFFDEDRARVDWSKTDELGFGHQFSLLAGVGLNISKVQVGLHFARTVTAYGVDKSVNASININAFP